MQAGHEQRDAQREDDRREAYPPARRGQRPGVRARLPSGAAARRARLPVRGHPRVHAAVGRRQAAPGRGLVERTGPPQRDQPAPHADPLPAVRAQHGQVPGRSQAEHDDGVDVLVLRVHGDGHGEQHQQRQAGQRGGPQPDGDQVGQHGRDADPARREQDQAGQFRRRRRVLIGVGHPGARQVPQPAQRARRGYEQRPRVTYLEHQVQVQQQSGHADGQADDHGQRPQPAERPAGGDGDDRPEPHEEPR
jgi:hypothetical protein